MLQFWTIHFQHAEPISKWTIWLFFPYLDSLDALTLNESFTIGYVGSLFLVLYSQTTLQCIKRTQNALQYNYDERQRCSYCTIFTCTVAEPSGSANQTVASRAIVKLPQNLTCSHWTKAMSKRGAFMHASQQSVVGWFPAQAPLFWVVVGDVASDVAELCPSSSFRLSMSLPSLSSSVSPATVTDSLQNSGVGR